MWIKHNANYLLLAGLYFAEGVPFGLQSLLIPILLRKKGYSLPTISILHILSLPWMLKFLVTQYFESSNFQKTRRWVIMTMVGTGISIFMTVNSDAILFTVIGLLGNSLSAALLDINVDGWAIRIIRNDKDTGIVNIIQVVSYKIGMLFTSAVFSATDHYLLVILLFYLGLMMVIYFLPPESIGFYEQQDKKERGPKVHDFYLNKIIQVFYNSGSVGILVFCIFYKCGEKGFVSMTTMLMLDNNISPTSVSLMRGVSSQIASIIGSLIGGLVYDTQRFCLHYFVLSRAICMLVEASAIMNNLPYTIAPIDITLHFVSGFITTQTFSLMMSTSKKSPLGLQNTHYAVLSSAELFGKLLTEISSGSITLFLGWKLYLMACFCAETCLLVLVAVIFQPLL